MIVGFKVPTAAVKNITIFWDMAPCSHYMDYIVLYPGLEVGQDNIPVHF
jgi:hypothetical protein